MYIRWPRNLTIVVLPLLCLGAGTARGVDFAGSWSVEDHIVNPIDATLIERWNVDQSGTVLTVTVNGSATHSGSLDVASGGFLIDLGPPESMPPFPPCPNGTITGTLSADGQSFSATAVAYFFHFTPPVGCFEENAELFGTRSLCGNGTLDPNEECDDGNAASGDCCSPSCHFEAAGRACGGGGECGAQSCDGNGVCAGTAASVCGDTCAPGSCSAGTCVVGTPLGYGTSCDADDNPCSLDICDGSGTCRFGGVTRECGACEACDAFAGCLVAPQRTCDSAPRGPFRLKGGDVSHKVAWKWKDPLVPQLPNDPMFTSLTLCVLDVSTPTAKSLLVATAPAGDTCAGKPCWAVGKSLQYRDKELTPDGLASVLLRATPEQGAQIILRGKGSNLATAPSFAGVTDVAVQLHTPYACYGTTYHDVKVGSGGKSLKARQ